MTGPHPRAVGSYGPAMLDWAATVPRLHPKPSPGARWWQSLVAARALEHDAAGRLVWPVVIISGPRQTGKSWLERDLCSWRIRQAKRFGDEEQAVLHVAHKLIAAQEVWRPAARWHAANGATVRWANGEQQIEMDDGSRWLLQAANDGTGVSFSLSMALIDEGWRIARAVYEDAIEPTTAESESPQAYLVSTAGTADSDLMLTYRTKAIAQLARPRDVLLIEWSAPPDSELAEPLDIDDPKVWRACQPHWDAKREAWIRRKRQYAGERAFRQQALNQWVPSLTPPALAPGTWGSVQTAHAPAGVLAFGVEVAEDQSAAIIVAVGGGIAEIVAEDEGASWAAARAADLNERHGGAGVGVDASGPASGVADELATAGVPLVKLTARSMAAATAQVHGALTARPRLLGLRDHPQYAAEVASVRWRRVGGGRAWDRDALALNATNCAWWALAHAPEPADEPMVYA